MTMAAQSLLCSLLFGFGAAYQRQVSKHASAENQTSVNDGGETCSTCAGVFPCSNYFKDQTNPCCCYGNNHHRGGCLSFTNECRETPDRPAIEPYTCKIEPSCGSSYTQGYEYTWTAAQGAAQAATTNSGNTARKLDGDKPGIKCFQYMEFQGCSRITLLDDDPGSFWGGWKQNVIITNNEDGWGHGSDSIGWGPLNSGKDCCKEKCKFEAPYDLRSDLRGIYIKACKDPPMPADKRTNHPRIKGR